MNEKTGRHIHLNMALIGGFFGGFAVINHMDLLASAQTSNLISLALILVGRSSTETLARLGSLGIYVLALVLTVAVPRVLKWNNQLVSIAVDILALISIAFMPDTLDHFVAMYPIFFAMAYQWCSFPTSDGYVSATIFSTNNLRQCVTAFASYLCDRDAKMLAKACMYGKVLLLFHIGVALSWFSCQYFGTHGALLALLPCFTALVQVLLSLNILSFTTARQASHI